MQRRREEENYRYLIVILWPRNQPRIKSEDGMSRESKSWPSSCQILRSQLTEDDETNRIWNLPVAVLWFPWDDIMNLFMWFYIMNFFGQNVRKRRLQVSSQGQDNVTSNIYTVYSNLYMSRSSTKRPWLMTMDVIDPIHLDRSRFNVIYFNIFNNLIILNNL